MGSLQTHKARLNRSQEKLEEKAFQVKRDALGSKRGRGKGMFHGRGLGRGRSQGNEQKNSSNDYRGTRSGIQCYHCKKYGHMQADYWHKVKQVNMVEEKEEESYS